MKAPVWILKSSNFSTFRAARLHPFLSVHIAKQVRNLNQSQLQLLGQNDSLKPSKIVCSPQYVHISIKLAIYLLAIKLIARSDALQNSFWEGCSVS